MSAGQAEAEVMLDLLEEAWGVIANAGWDDCAKSPGWQEAAVRWRDRYFALDSHPDQITMREITMQDNTAPGWQTIATSDLRHDVVRRTSGEIAEVMDWAADLVEASDREPDSHPASGWSYAHGVSDGIAWLLGQSEDNPKEH